MINYNENKNNKKIDHLFNRPRSKHGQKYMKYRMSW